MRTTRWLPVGLMVALLPASGCVGSQNCTLVGCESGVNFDVDAPFEPGEEFRVSACVDDICREARGAVPERGCTTESDLTVCGPQSGGTDVHLRLPNGTYDKTYDVRFELVSGSGETLAQADASVDFQRSQPNGPDCGPICWSASVPTSP